MTLMNAAAHESPAESANTALTRPDFYLVARDGAALRTIPGEEFATGYAARDRALALTKELGLKVEPRQRSPKIRQPKKAKAGEPAVDLDATPEGYDPGNPMHVSLLKLHRILSHRRQMGGWGEAQVIAEYIDSIPGMQSDAIGNRYVCIGSHSPRVMWSCHTDSVHCQDGLQNIILHEGFLVLARGSGSSCLGADDGAGIWLMIEMIAAGVPGLYVFHHGEESGCIGSKWLVKNTPELVEGIDYAIAFDRAGLTDVITHQIGGRCCSDAFAKSLAEQLPGGYRPDPNGVYTDTAHYTHLIPECTNISVGYYDQHTAHERVNVYHLMDLRDALVAFDETRLIAPVRKVTDVDDGRFDHSAQSSWGWRSRWSDGDDGSVSNSRGAIGASAYGTMIGEWEDEDDRWHQGLHSFSESRRGGGYNHRPQTLSRLLEFYPDEAADVLESWGIDKAAIWEEIQQLYGSR